jgi:hypothetical protein
LGIYTRMVKIDGWRCITGVWVVSSVAQHEAVHTSMESQGPNTALALGNMSV